MYILGKRKDDIKMPRIARSQLNSIFKHVMVQGINKEYIFGKEEYIRKYKEIICIKQKEYNIKILAFCIMDNHAHFLIYNEKSEELSKFMQKLNTSYSIYYNKVNNRIGYVFRDRYKSKPILSQRQLYTCLRYIHYNPIKANICENLNQYPHSSYNEFFENPKIIDSKSKEILFGNKDNFEEIFNIIHKERKEINNVSFENIEEFIRKIEEKYRMNIKDIKDNRKVLKLVIEEARNGTDVTIMKLAKILGVSKTTVGRYSKNLKLKKELS